MQFTMIRGMASVAVLAGFASVTAANAQTNDPAQTPQQGVSVTERPRPDVDPLGIRGGGFLLFPKLAVSGEYDDNVFATDTGKTDDYITVISPSFRAQSDWNNHSLVLRGGADIARYADNGDEDYEHFNFGADGRLDVLRDTYLKGGLNFISTTEERGSPDDANGIEPTEYTIFTPSVGAFHRFNRVSLAVDGKADIYDFDDVRTSTGTVNNDDRDRTRYEFRMQGNYEIVPQYEAFVRATLNSVDYDWGTDDTGVNRDSKGYEFAVGTRVDLTGVVTGDVFVGYRNQDYDAASLKSVDGISFGGALTWNITGLTTIKGSVARTVEETTQSGASGYFNTTYAVSVDHELLRNLLAGAKLRLTNSDYEGIAREDDIYNFGVYGRYLMHRNLYLSLNYDYINRDSSVSGADYDKNVVMLRLETQL